MLRLTFVVTGASAYTFLDPNGIYFYTVATIIRELKEVSRVYSIVPE